MQHLLSFLFNRFFADKNGVSRGWQVFLFLTLIGIGLAAWVAWKAGGPKQPRFHGSMFVVLPLMFAAVGGMFWMADVARRKRFTREARQGGAEVNIAIAQETMRNKRSAGLIAAVIGVTVVPFILFKFGGIVVKEYASLNWTPMNCRIVHFDVHKPWDTYQCRITVAYEVNGVPHGAVVDAPTANSVKYLSEARRIELQYQPGTQHRLYVNPHNPREASLRRGPSVGAVIATVTMPVFGLICVAASLRFMTRGRLSSGSCASTVSNAEQPLKRAA